MTLTTRQIIAMRNIADALKQYYSDCNPLTTDFISPAWVEVIEDRTALICDQCNGEGSVGTLRPDGYDSEKCVDCDGSGLNLKVTP